MGEPHVKGSDPFITAQHRHRWLILLVLACSLLLIAMDATVLNVALPTLAADLRPGAAELLWIVDAYGLVLAGLLVAMGGLGDRIGRRRLLTLGLVVFGAASVAAGLAGSSEQLIAARVALGVGGAMIMPSTLSVLRNVFLDDRERTIALGVWSAVAAGGFALGPIVGGAILEVAAWGWVFAAQVPVVLIALLSVRRLVPESRNPDPGPFDPAGVALSVGGMVAFVYGVKEAGKHGLDAASVGIMLAGLGLLAGFVARQARSSHPLVDVRLFADRRFATATVAVLFTFFGLAGLLLLLTQHLQIVQGHSPLGAGVRLLPLAVAAAMAAPLTDVLVRRAGPHVAVGGGFALIAGGLALLAGLEAATPYGTVAAALSAIGVGAGIASTAGSAAIMASAPPERAGGAAAVQETAFELGGALGVAILGSLASSAYRDALDGELAGVPGVAADAARESLPGAAEVAATIGGRAGAAVLDAASAAFLDGFVLTAVISAAAMAAIAAAALAFMPRRPTLT
jgi:DHA2 family multidrug resistance protein-like MFS transporter